MTKHAQVAEGDRHSPVNRTFNNAAARLAYTYTADDVGKWYKDDDTNIVWALDNSYLPGFSQVSAVGTALYNFPFKVITVDLNEPSADYNNMAAAIAAAVSGDVISIGPGTYTCNAQTLPAGVDIVGFGIGITILTTTGVTALTVGNDSHVADMTIQSINAAGNSYPIIMSGADSVLDNVKGSASDTAGTNAAQGIRVAATADSTKLINCEGESLGASSNGSYGLYAASSVDVRYGRYYGANNAINSDAVTVTVAVPMLVGTMPLLKSNGGTIVGSYLDEAGNIVVGRYETGDLPSAGQGGRLMYDITTGHLVLDVGLSLIDYTP